jgi:UDP:flavonoid glycosyltransferase YjiC (YdhE family)
LTAWTPLRVLFSVRPYRGHFNPIVPLARAFRRAGHHVAVATAEDIAGAVTATGLPWLPAGINPRDATLVSGDENPDYGYAAIGFKVRDILEIAVEQFRPDVVIREPTDLAPAIAGEILGAFNVIFGVAYFIPAESWRILGADKAIAALRRDYGLSKDPDLECLYRDLYLTLLPGGFEPFNPLPVASSRRIRYVPWDGDGSASSVSPQPGGRARVLVTLGTVYNHDTDLFERFLDAMEGEDVDVVCTLGEGMLPPDQGQTRANVHFEQYLPHTSILPTCQGMLCHGGFNTMMGALCFGVPMVCVPLGSDQLFNARKVDENGAGIWLREEETSPEQIREAVRRILHDPSFAGRARQIQDRIARALPLPVVVHDIQTRARQRRTVEQSPLNQDLPSAGNSGRSS